MKSINFLQKKFLHIQKKAHTKDCEIPQIPGIKNTIISISTACFKRTTKKNVPYREQEQKSRDRQGIDLGPFAGHLHTVGWEGVLSGEGQEATPGMLFCTNFKMD